MHRRAVQAAYKRPPVKAFTDACEAPHAMWANAIPLRPAVVSDRDGHKWSGTERTYNHPAEKSAAELSFSDINGMYCVGNDALQDYFAEGVPGKVMQTFVPGHPRGFLYRRESHLLNSFIQKAQHWKMKRDVLGTLTNGRPGFIFDGETGTGKSALMAQAVHFARSRGICTVFVPNARDWTHGEFVWPNVLLPGFWDVPDAGRNFLMYTARSNKSAFQDWKLRVTPPMPVEKGESTPTTLLELCQWGYNAPAPSSVDRQSVALKYVMDEFVAEQDKTLLFVVDGMNLFAHETHFRFPHPDFYRKLHSLASTDVDMQPQELARIPAARLGFVRSLNRMMLSDDKNKFFVGATTRDFKPFDGVAGFPMVEQDKFKTALDEYAPFDAARDSILHPMKLNNFDEYEYRSYLRFLVNSGELAGLGWGPMWHYSSDFERKLYKIDILSQRNPQRVIDHYHQELVWKMEYSRVRQKQKLTQSQK